MTATLPEQELRARVKALTTQVEELTQRLDQSGPTPAGSATARLLFPDVEHWVRGWFLPMFGWRVDGQRWYWCPQWWRHAEAIWRLELLWRSWEAARLHPLGMSGWSAELDRHKWELLGDEGPFRQCRSAENDRPAGLPPGGRVGVGGGGAGLVAAPALGRGPRPALRRIGDAGEGVRHNPRWFSTTREAIVTDWRRPCNAPGAQHHYQRGFCTLISVRPGTVPMQYSGKMSYRDKNGRLL